MKDRDHKKSVEGGKNADSHLIQKDRRGPVAGTARPLRNGRWKSKRSNDKTKNL